MCQARRIFLWAAGRSSGIWFSRRDAEARGNRRFYPNRLKAVLGNFDMEYIKNWSVWLDLKIVWLTIWWGFGGKGAY